MFPAPPFLVVRASDALPVGKVGGITMARFSALSALAICIIALAAGAAVANNGGDVSQLWSTDTYRCAKDHLDWSFMIARSYHSYGAVDPNGRQNTINARAAGIQYTDVYHFPCVGKISAQQQMEDDVTHTGRENFGMMWFDIETSVSPGCEWSSDKSRNCAFMGDLIRAGQGLSLKLGIYSSVYMWGLIMGDDCHVGADNHLPLWYAHYDHNPTFSDFQSFGGWTRPNVKQYWDSVGECGINADADWYPA